MDSRVFGIGPEYSDSASLGSNPSPPATENDEKYTLNASRQTGQGGTERALRTHKSRHNKEDGGAMMKLESFGQIIQLQDNGAALVAVYRRQGDAGEAMQLAERIKEFLELEGRMTSDMTDAIDIALERSPSAIEFLEGLRAQGFDVVKREGR